MKTFKTLLPIILVLLLMLSLTQIAMAEPQPNGGGEAAQMTTANGDGNGGDGEPPQGGGMFGALGPLLMFVPLILIFYFMILRPEKRRKAAAQKLRDDLIVSDEVVTMGGLVGKVVQIKDDQITIETSSERTRITLQRAAIVSRKETISE